MTGVFVAGVNEVSSFEADGWEVSLFTQTFSPEIKEPETGADMGIIVDIRREAEQVSKAAWVQAKLAARLGTKIASLQDMADQLRDIQRHTKEAYGAVYTPAGSELFHADQPDTRMGVGDFTTDLIRCRRGDRSPRLIADTVDFSLMMELTFLGPGSDRTFFRTAREPASR